MLPEEAAFAASDPIPTKLGVLAPFSSCIYRSFASYAGSHKKEVVQGRVCAEGGRETIQFVHAVVDVPCVGLDEWQNIHIRFRGTVPKRIYSPPSPLPPCPYRTHLPVSTVTVSHQNFPTSLQFLIAAMVVSAQINTMWASVGGLEDLLEFIGWKCVPGEGFTMIDTSLSGWSEASTGDGKLPSPMSMVHAEKNDLSRYVRRGGGEFV